MIFKGALCMQRSTHGLQMCNTQRFYWLLEFVTHLKTKVMAYSLLIIKIIMKINEAHKSTQKC